VSALLHRRQLVLEVDASGTSLDHVLHDFVGVQHAPKAGFRVGDNRGQPVRPVAVLLAFFVMW
jgi:hypothetical protein